MKIFDKEKKKMAALPTDEDAPVLNDAQFRELVLKFQEDDDKLKQINTKVAPIRKRQRARKDRMLEYMKRTGRKGVLIKDRTEQMVLENKERKVKMDEDMTRRRILQAVKGDKGTAGEVYSFLYENPETEIAEVLSRKKTAFGRADASFEASEIAQIDPSELTDANEIKRYAKAKETFNQMNEMVRRNEWFEA